LPNHPEQGYLLSTVLASPPAAATRWTKIKADDPPQRRRRRHRPKGTIYYLLNQDIRAKTRKWGFNPAIEQLKQLGVAGEIVDGVLPRNKKDVAGIMAGIADFEWNKYGSTLLPGAICEHLTSNGGCMMVNGGQTCISEFIRAGASGTSGAVFEPFAIQEKFPTPSSTSTTPPAARWPRRSTSPSPALSAPDHRRPPLQTLGQIRRALLGIQPGATLKGTLAVQPPARRAAFPSPIRALR